IRAKFTVDASGAYAVVRKKLPDEMLNDGIVRELTDDDQWPSYREIIQLNKDTPHHDYDNEIILLYKDDFAPPGYFWIFTKGERQLNCGIGWMKYQSKNLGSVKKGYLKELNNYYKPEDYTVLKTGGGQIPVRPPFDSLVFNGGALAGDAACMVHPVTAEGHGPALDTAVHLGNSIVKGLKKNQRNKEVLWDYNIEVSRHYAKKHSQAVIMRDFLEKVGAKSLEYLIKKQIFKNEEMDLIFSGEELILSGFDKLKRGLKLVRKPRLLLNLIKIFSRVDKCETIFENYPINHKELMNWRKHRNKILDFNF
ncbi:MAG: NAD(P)/FAD-dependent oxidoreductase, partial [Candidatus Heimdallarchaeota archaeon]|nr:NAD(P)/FAD-dependent oxidoreductase [Candidatus Heimdallarchaeota archaeon]